MVRAVGTVSTRGWATTPEHMLSEAFKNFAEAGFSQTIIYRGNIKSLSYIRKQYAGLPEEMSSAVAESLTSLLNNVFDIETATVQCEAIYESEGGAVFYLDVAAQVTVNGVTYDASDKIKISED